MPDKDFNLKFVQALIDKKLITKDQLQEVIEEIKKSGQSIETVILAKGLAGETEILQIKSKILGIEPVNLKTEKVAKEILSVIPEELAQNYKVVAFDKVDDVLKVAIVDPMNLKAREAVNFIARQKGLKTQYYLTDQEGLSFVFRSYGDVASQVESALKAAKERIEVEPEEEMIATEEGVQDMIKSAPVSKMIDIILQQAVEKKASDIHIEPLFKETRVRYRIDGILKTFLTLPKYIHSALISRVKVISNLKIDETRIPQDGRFRITVNNKPIDFRVSTLPLVENEKVVMRILDTPEKAPTLEDLGFSGRALDVMHDRIKTARGIFLVAGPTGSGKTTTLYSILSVLNREEVNIITLEDPIEYYLAGVSQSQINADVGFTFASGLRSILRQDPDIIMVGEIRDDETAELAIHAGLTGHIVLSTLHTSDSFGAIPRLTDMNVEPFLITSTLNVVVAQRLGRHLCQKCKKEVTISPELRQEIVDHLKEIPNLEEYWPAGIDNLKFYRGEGCDECGGSGYKGRIAIVEVLPMTDKLKEIIEAKGNLAEMKAEFRRQKMITLEEDGIIKALRGETTIEEVLRVTRE
ncbi:MAG: GspE/PulE family protein [Patescibacteria group bacterium]